MFWVHDKFGNGSQACRVNRSVESLGLLDKFASSSPPDTFRSSGPPNPFGSPGSLVLLEPSDPLTRLGCQVGSDYLCLRAHPTRWVVSPIWIVEPAWPVYVVGPVQSVWVVGSARYILVVGPTWAVWVVGLGRPVWVVKPARPICVIKSLRLSWSSGPPNSSWSSGPLDPFESSSPPDPSGSSGSLDPFGSSGPLNPFVSLGWSDMSGSSQPVMVVRFVGSVWNWVQSVRLSEKNFKFYLFLGYLNFF